MSKISNKFIDLRETPTEELRQSYREYKARQKLKEDNPMKNSKVLGKMIVKFGVDDLEITKAKTNVRDGHICIRYFVRILRRN